VSVSGIMAAIGLFGRTFLFTRHAQGVFLRRFLRMVGE
jgi:hypothetical protein